MKESILILGAGVTQVPLIVAAKRKGYRALVASIPGNYPGFQYADACYHVNTTDLNGILEIAKTNNISGICTTGTDVAVRSIGYVNTEMHLKGIQYEQAKIVTDKALMKAALVDGGVRTAKFFRAYCVEDALKYAEMIGYPVMVKCTDQAGSRGITKVECKEDIEQAVEYALQGSRNNYVVVEQFLQGYEIGLDGYYEHGHFEFIPHDKQTFNNGVTDVPLGHSLPLSIEKDLYDDIILQAKRSCEAIGLNHVFINMDLMIVDNQCYVIEIGGRTGATCIPDLLSLYCGYNYYEKIIENCVGDKVDMSYTPQCACISELLVSDVSGILTKADISLIDNDPDVQCSIDISIGEKVRAFHVGQDRFGQIIVRADNMDAALVKLNVAKRLANIEIVQEIPYTISCLQANDFEKCVKYLYEIDKIFPVPMSSRVDIKNHLKKVMDLGVVFVAEYQERFIGILLGYANDSASKRAYLGTLGISDGYRDIGVGTKLVEEFCKYAQNQGMCSIGLHAHRDNARACKFYEKNHFQQTVDNDKPYEESVYYTKSLI